MKRLLELKILSTRRRIITAAIICLALLGYVDWITGPNVAITCFYLIPVCLMTWFVGKKIGYTVSAIHAIIWLAIDIDTLGFHAHLIFWNALMRFITFAAVVWLVNQCKNLMAEIEMLVKAKTEVLQREVESRAEAQRAIQRLANELSAAEDVERRRLGQALHESMGQSLSLLKLRMESMAGDLSPDHKLARELHESLSLLTTVIRDSRTLTFELYPSMLDQLGLTVTLQHYAEQLSARSRAKIRVVDFGPAMTLPDSIASFLFRAVKELLTNALKHGRAGELLVQIRRQHDHIRIVVNDDGSGFDPDAPPSAGIGLPWIKERLRSLSGTLQIESTPGRGTRVTLDLFVRPSLPQLGTIVHGEPIAG